MPDSDNYIRRGEIGQKSQKSGIFDHWLGPLIKTNCARLPDKKVAL